MIQFSKICLALLLALLTAGAQSTTTAIYPPTATHPGSAWFVDRAAAAGLDLVNVNGDPANKRYIIESTGSGVAILDFDGDGWPDIFLVNGNTLPPTQQAKPAPQTTPAKASTTPPTSHLFRNNHDGTFTDVTAKAGLTVTGWGQGACVGDFDNDGHEDLFVTGYGHNHLFHNNGNGTFTDVSVEAGVAGHRRRVGHRLRLCRL